MAIWFKNSNAHDVANGVAYYEEDTQDHVDIHFKPGHLAAARQIAPETPGRSGDVLVVFQAIRGMGRVITHVLVCTGPIQQVANPDNGFTYKLPTRVLARLNADLFAPNGTRDPNLGRLLSERPPSLSKAIGDVVRDIATDTAPGPGWSVTGGRPYTVYGGNQNGRCVVDLDLLIAAVSQDGQFHKVDGFDQIVRAAARWGTPQAAGRPGRRGSAAQPA